jgi:predicted DNA-binding protein YlxM (UPF0122 family)
MTNADLLRRQMALRRAAEIAETTRMKYAIQKNLKRIERALAAYQEMLQDLQQDGTDPQVLQQYLNALLFGQEIPEGVDKDLIHDLQELLDQDAGEVDVHTVPVHQLDKEDDKGADFPFAVVSQIDFMIEDL